MVFKRKGRSTFTFQGRTPTGWEQIGISTKDKPLANRVEDMWEALANKDRAWDILEPVLDAGRKRAKQVMRLYDLWIDCGRDVEEMRRKLNDVDIEPLVDEYLGVYGKSGVDDKSVEAAGRHLRYLLPADVVCRASSINSDLLTKKLYEYGDNPTTLGTVYTSWNGYFKYLVMPKMVYTASPMAHVAKPGKVNRPIRFYELELVIKIIEAQPDVKRKALFALMYGSAIESSIVVGKDKGKNPIPPLTRADFNEATHEVRAGGTKAHTRDRVARVSDWAWGYVERYLKTMLPHTPLWEHHATTLSHWHSDTIDTLNGKGKLYPKHRLYNARHHWAVRQLRSGAPVGLVQKQLGHATAKQTLDTYGRFAPDGYDREKWDKAATAYDKKRAAK